MDGVVAMKRKRVCPTCPQRRRYTDDGESECPVCRKWVGVWRQTYIDAGCPDNGPPQVGQPIYRQKKGKCATCDRITALHHVHLTCSFCRGTNRVSALAPRRPKRVHQGYAENGRRGRHGDGRSRFSGQGKE